MSFRPQRRSRHGSSRVLALPRAFAPLAALALIPALASSSLASDGVWSPFPLTTPGPTTPGLRHGHSMVLDETHQRLVVFGGYQSGVDTPLGDSWFGTLAAVPSFAPIAVAPDPGLRYGHAAVYDPPRQRMLVFDGIPGGASPMDVWAMDLSGSGAWASVATSGVSPPRRQGCGVVRDPVRDRILIFGGYDGAFSNEVLVFTPGAPAVWSVLSVIGTPPAPRNYAAVVYDPVRDRMVVFAGNSGPAYQDVHVLDLSVTPAVWTNLAPAGSPPDPRLAPSAIYDPVGDRMVVFGGIQAPATYYGDTWELSLAGSPTWTQLSSTGPSPRHSAAVARDAAGARMLLYGGEASGHSRGDVWSLALGGPPVWTLLHDDPSVLGEPHPATHGHVFTYDPPRRRILTVGGQPFSGGPSTGLLHSLELDPPSHWKRLSTFSPSPGPLWGASMNRDPALDRMLLFGGYLTSTGWGNGLWELPLAGAPAWNLLATTSAPPGRNYHVAVIDPVRNRLVIQGGNQAGVFLNDLWRLDLSTLVWTQVVVPPGGPSPRLAHRAVHDPLLDRVVVFGGLGAAGDLGDLWVLDLGTLTWSQWVIPGGPSPRHSHGMALDESRRRILVHGGLAGDESLDDLWELDLGPSPSWRLLTTDGSCPARHGHGAAYDPVADRLVVFGGFSKDVAGPLGDTWQFLPEDSPTPSLASLASAWSEPGRVRLAWYWAEGGGRAATIERREETEGWTEMGRATFAGDGRLEFEDGTVRPGERYAYRLAWLEGADVLRSSESWVQVPSGYRLAVNGFQPNPSPGDAPVSFSLPVAGSGSIEVIDVTGRRVASKSFAKLAAGLHRLPLGGAGLAPGVYVLRLTFGDRTVVTRGAVVR